MTMRSGVIPEWLDDQIGRYRAVRPRYEQYAAALKTLLEREAKDLVPLATVQARAKTIESFGEKATHKWPKHRSPVDTFTDLCGARVITPTRRGVEAMCRFVEDYFEIDWGNTVTNEQRLKPMEFHYRSVHYVVSPKAGSSLASRFAGMKAEVQIRTVLEHGWSDFTHDRSYKGAFRIPDAWERRADAIAAMIEVADGEFIDIEDGLKTYAATYGQYLTKDQLDHEMRLLECILGHVPGNADLAARIGKLAITAEDWRKAESVLRPHSASRNPSVLRDLGLALCKIHKQAARSGDKEAKAQYRQGQGFLKKAIRLAPQDVDAICCLAGTWKGFDEKKAAGLYHDAFEIDPADPYVLCNHLDCQITEAGDLSPLGCLGPIIRQSIQRCRDQAAVGMNMPWAHYSRGLFHLLLKDPYRSFASYAKALQMSSASFMISTSLDTLERLDPVSSQLPGYEWLRRLLMLGLAVRFASSDQAAKMTGALLSTEGAEKMAGPVVILAGGCDASIQPEMERYRPLLLESFRGFQGTLIGGGTTAGISGIAGDVQKQYQQAITTVGYVPQPANKSVPDGVEIDARYSEVRRPKGEAFTPLEPLQSWIDIFASDIDPHDVRVLGVNGGDITAAEYRLALAMGAKVAVVEESGREATRLLADEDWRTSGELFHLPPEPLAVNAYVMRGVPMLPPDIRESVAKAVHGLYRRNQAKRKPPDDPSMAEWELLREDLKESNRQQADHFQELLRRVGCSIYPVNGREIKLMEFTPGEIETMAELEHRRWNQERFKEGWEPGPVRDVEKKISPYLVTWSELPDDIREYDRETVRGIPELLASV